MLKGNIKISGYTGEPIRSLGHFVTSLEYEKKLCSNFKFFVIEKGGPILLGRDFLKEFNLKLSKVNLIQNTTINLKVLETKYKKIFDNELGKYLPEKFKIRIKENVTLIFYKPRPIPFSFREQVEVQLKRLEKLGVISPTESSEWGSPLVPILKSDGSIRICADYKVTVNKFVQNVRYPLPRIKGYFSQS